MALVFAGGKCGAAMMNVPLRVHLGGPRFADNGRGRGLRISVVRSESRDGPGPPRRHPLLDLSRSLQRESADPDQAQGGP